MAAGTADFPIPGTGRAAVAVSAPGTGPGCWTGAPSASLAPDASLVIAYRTRTPDRRGASVVVARSADGESFETLATLEKERFGAESLERPALIRMDDGWRIYVSCATPGSKHWRIDAIDASDPSRLDGGTTRTVFAGSASVGVKDPVVRRAGDVWHAWVCCHPLDQVGEEDRMSTGYATSRDGLAWLWHGEVLAGRPGMWDARGARVTSVLPDGRASYDGRATKEENFSERTGIAAGRTLAGPLIASGESPVANVRYLDVLPHPAGGFIAFYEKPRDDGSHDLWVERFDRGQTP